jgi:hypothetical protein
MRQRSFRVLVSLCFLLLLGVGAQGQGYTRPMRTPDGGAPTDADIVLYNGASNTLTVQLLNLTPYDIQFVHTSEVTSWSITSANEASMQDGNHTAKSFMFVPAGIPTLVPRAPEEDFLTDPKWQATTFYPAGTEIVDSNGYVEVVLRAGTSGATEPTWNKTPGGTTADGSVTWTKYVDTVTHPYAMVFAWDDRGGFVEDNWVKWTIKGVKYSCDKNGCRDVSLGLWMYRNKPTSKLMSASLYDLVKKSLWGVLDTFTLLVEIENPMAWAHEFLAVTEVVKTSTEFAKENSQENDGAKMWVASYVIPHPTSNCVRWQQEGTGSKCQPAPLTADDAVVSQWSGDIAGPCYDVAGKTTCPNDAAEGELVVSVHVLRGQKAKQCDPVYYPNKCPLGNEPVVMITVMRAGDFVVGTLAGATRNLSSGAEIPTDKIRLFLLQAGAGRIGELLEKQGRLGLLVLRSLVEGLDPAQQQVLREMVRTMGSGRLPTQQERQLVHLLADELKARLLHPQSK